MSIKNDDIVLRHHIEAYLYQLCNAEKKLKSYYQMTNSNISVDTIYKESSNPQSTFGYTFNTDLQCINEKNYFKLKESLLFSETDWFHPFLDVSIHKHMAYFPSFRHVHAFYELCYVLQGNCQQTVYNRNNTHSLQLSDGDILILPPGLEHEVSMNSESVVVNILLRESTFKHVFFQNLPSDTPLYSFFSGSLYNTDGKDFMLCHTDNDAVLKDLFFDIAEEYCNNAAYANNIINQELSVFFCKLLRRHNSQFSFGAPGENRLTIIPSVLQYIDTNYSSTSVQEIADHFGFTPTYLSKLFKQQTGTSLIEALVQTRIAKAQHLLRTTSQTIDHIANMVGYNDATYFIRKFKQLNGITPFQYRKANGN